MQPTTYSFLDIVGTMFHPLAGEFLFQGAQGVQKIDIEYLDDRTSSDLAADGAVVVSAMPGRRANVTLEMQQTSPYHHYLLSLANVIQGNLDNNDVSQWATATLSFRAINEGSMHFCTGMAPVKIPPKSYANKNQNVTWVLFAASVISE